MGKGRDGKREVNSVSEAILVCAWIPISTPSLVPKESLITNQLVTSLTPKESLITNQLVTLLTSRGPDQRS